jgi:hypothetical protein
LSSASEPAAGSVPTVPLAHGGRMLPAVTVDTYNEELRDDDGFVGDRASRRAFRAILADWRDRLKENGETRRRTLLDEATGPAGEAAAADREVSAVELAFWDSVKDSANPEMYSAYLERYPEGAFAALAKVRLDELASSPP